MIVYKNEFLPFEGTSNIKFGTKRAEIRELLGTCETFIRNEFADNSTDHFIELNLFVEYDSSNLCEALEFTDASNLYLNGVDLMALSPIEIRQQFDTISKNMDEDHEFSVTYYDLGIAFSGDDEGVRSILIFSQDYWDDEQV